MVAEAPAASNLTVFPSPSTLKENYASGAACTVFPSPSTREVNDASGAAYCILHNALARNGCRGSSCFESHSVSISFNS